jgi:Asp-tRNAAsn/Glu-tRNAGln amidotransferase A subunit and related amidases
MSDSLVEKTAVELRQLIGSKQVSPVELLDACIARIEDLNPHINAVTATCLTQGPQGSAGGRAGGHGRG